MFIDCTASESWDILVIFPLTWQKPQTEIREGLKDFSFVQNSDRKATTEQLGSWQEQVANVVPITLGRGEGKELGTQYNHEGFIAGDTLLPGRPVLPEGSKSFQSCSSRWRTSFRI